MSMSTLTTEEVSEDTLDLDDMDLPAEWSRFKEGKEPSQDGCGALGCSYCNRPSHKSFQDWLRARLTDPDQIDDLQWCEPCNEPGTDLNWTGDETHVCDSCFENYYFCEDCELSFRKTTTTPRNGEVCEGCLENYSYCEECDGYYRDGDGCGQDHDNSCQCEAPAQVFTVRNDGDEPLANDERVTVALPAGTISAEGLSQIAHYIRDGAYSADVAERDSLYNLSYSVPELGDRWQTKEGNFTKRLSKLAYKKHGLKVRPDMLSQIGCIARDNSTAVDFEIEVTRDLNLPAEDFYHGDSCWWQSYAASRCALKNNGGLGLRTFSERGSVTGRAWVMPLKIDEGGNLTPTFETLEPAAFMVFNGYGNLSGYTPARIISHMAGMTYRKIYFTCPPMYVNGDSGYLVAPEEIAHKYTDGSLHLAVDDHSTLHHSEEVRTYALVA